MENSFGKKLLIKMVMRMIISDKYIELIDIIHNGNIAIYMWIIINGYNKIQTSVKFEEIKIIEDYINL